MNQQIFGEPAAVAGSVFSSSFFILFNRSYCPRVGVGAGGGASAYTGTFELSSSTRGLPEFF